MNVHLCSEWDVNHSTLQIHQKDRHYLHTRVRQVLDFYRWNQIREILLPNFHHFVKNLAENMVFKNVKFFFAKHKKFTTIAKF